MAWSVIASAEGSNSAAGTTLACSSSLNVATGDLLVAWAKHEGTDGTFAMTDGASNVITFDAADEVNHSNGDLNASFGYRLAGVANATATFTLTTLSRPYRRVIVWQCRPDAGDTVAKITDGSATGQGNGTAPTSGAITIAGDDLVVFGGYGEFFSDTVSARVINGAAAEGFQDVDLSFTSSWYDILAAGFTNGTAACTLGTGGDDWICNIISFSATAPGGDPEGLLIGGKLSGRGLLGGVLVN